MTIRSIFAAACIATGIASPSWAGTFTLGEFLTFDQSDWGNPIAGAGPLLDANFASVYGGTFLEVGIPGTSGHSIFFTSSGAILNYLPANGVAGPLIDDAIDPVTLDDVGIFGGTVVGLQLDLDFNDALLFGGTSSTRFGDLVLGGFVDASGISFSSLNGMTVRSFVALAQTVLGGGPIIPGFTYDNFDAVAEVLGNAFPGGAVSPFAQDHLFLPEVVAAVPEPADWMMMLLAFCTLPLLRRFRAARRSAA